MQVEHPLYCKKVQKALALKKPKLHQLRGRRLEPYTFYLGSGSVAISTIRHFGTLF